MSERDGSTARAADQGPDPDAQGGGLGGGDEGTRCVDPRVVVRRRDRSKDDAWIRAFLERALVGVFAMHDPDGGPRLNSNLFVYDAGRHALYFHTARTGRTPDSVGTEGIPLAFTATTYGRFLPADEALEFSVEYGAVVAFGRARVVEDDAEATQALQALLDRYAPHLEPGRDYRPPVAPELSRTAVFRMDVQSWSGKEKAADPDFPGAYELEDVAVPLNPRASGPAPPAPPRSPRPGPSDPSP